MQGESTPVQTDYLHSAVGEVITKQASIQDGDSNFLSSDDEDMQRDIDMKRELDLTLSTQ